MTYTPTRKIMTRDELASHHADRHPRDYARSGDGYDDMELARRKGWAEVSSWGRDGWDLGSWPYVAIYTRETNPGTLDGDGKLTRVYELMQVVEGDHDTPEDRDAALDYLFLWYAADRHWAPITTDQRPALDAGYPLAIADKWRGPYRTERTS